MPKIVRHNRDKPTRLTSQTLDFAVVDFHLSRAAVLILLNLGNVADEQVILFLAFASSDNLRLGIQFGIGLGLWLGLGSVLIAGLTSTF